MAHKEKRSGEHGRLSANDPQSPAAQAQRRPLIDYCTNEWQRNPPHNVKSGPITFADRVDDSIDDLHYCSMSLLQSRKFRRLFGSLVCFTVAAIVLWITYLGPYIAENQAALASLEMESTRGLFGSNVRPHFPDMVHIKDLNSQLLPSDSIPRHGNRNNRRLIFIGDIHGCKKELRNLLDAVKFNPENDHIIAAGDMISKGPDSLGVLDLLMESGASCVRGNHEDRILLLAAQMVSPLRHNDWHTSPRLDRIDERSFSDHDEKLARSLNSKQLDYLKSCPVILRVGEMIPLGGQIVVVHAGLVPGVPLERQDPTSVMSMRIIDLATHVPSRDHSRKGSIAWAKLWNRYQKLANRRIQSFSTDPEEQRRKQIHTTVIYGHDSKQGLQIEKYSKGLDTGCVKGGKLTALVLMDGGRQDIKQVKCRDFREPRKEDSDSLQ